MTLLWCVLAGAAIVTVMMIIIIRLGVRLGGLARMVKPWGGRPEVPPFEVPAPLIGNDPLYQLAQRVADAEEADRSGRQT